MPAPRRIAHRALTALALLVALTLMALPLQAYDWPRFRGENGAGVSTDAKAPPTEWGDDKNLAWSADLPGPGSSCPIVIGDRVILTCWTGADAPEMVRHLLCFDRKTGQQLWDTPIKPTVEDEPYRGRFAEHGYASHTPTSDGKFIYCFFGLDGVHAFDMDGHEKWQVSVGSGTDPRGWGTSSSPMLSGDLVIITAGAESRTIYALKKENGEEAWKLQDENLKSLWGTPILCDNADGTQDLVLGVPGELWGIIPATGKRRWHASSGFHDSKCSSAISAGGVVFTIGEGDTHRTVAVQGGGDGDMSDKVLWNIEYYGRITTPVLVDGLMYDITKQVVTCFDAATGEQVYSEKLPAPSVTGAPAAGEGQAAPAGAAEAPGGGRGGRGGRGGPPDYSSPVVAGGKLYFVRRGGEVHVLQTGREFKQLAVNKFAGEADYSASPAISDGQLFIRSSKKLYCITEK